MPVTFVRIEAPKIEQVAGVAHLFDPKKLAKHTADLLFKTVREKKAYADEVSEAKLRDLLRDEVLQKLVVLFKRAIQQHGPLTAIEIFANKAIFSWESKLFLKYEAKSNGQVEIPLDWKSLRVTPKPVAKLPRPPAKEAPRPPAKPAPAPKLTTVRVLAHPDLWKVIEPRLAPEARALIGRLSLPLVAIVNEKKAIEFLSMNPASLALLQKAADAADYGRICDGAIGVIEAASADASKRGTLEKDIDAAMDAAVASAVEEMARAAKMRFDRKMYAVMAKVKISLV